MYHCNSTWGYSNAFVAISDCFMLLPETNDLYILKAGHLLPVDYGTRFTNNKWHDRPADKVFDKYFDDFINEYNRVLGDKIVELDVVRSKNLSPETLLSGDVPREKVKWSFDNCVFLNFHLFGEDMYPVSPQMKECVYIPFIDNKPLHDSEYNKALAHVIKFYSQYATYVQPMTDDSKGKSTIQLAEEMYLDHEKHFGWDKDLLNAYITCLTEFPQLSDEL